MHFFSLRLRVALLYIHAIKQSMDRHTISDVRICHDIFYLFYKCGERRANHAFLKQKVRLVGKKNESRGPWHVFFCGWVESRSPLP
jgi:hypothetical protein